MIDVRQEPETIARFKKNSCYCVDCGIYNMWWDSESMLLLFIHLSIPHINVIPLTYVSRCLILYTKYVFFKKRLALQIYKLQLIWFVHVIGIYILRYDAYYDGLKSILFLVISSTLNFKSVSIINFLKLYNYIFQPRNF